MQLSYLLLTVLLVPLCSARQPKTISVTLDKCAGHPAPVNASYRPLECESLNF